MTDLGKFGRWQVMKRLAPAKRRVGDHGVRARVLVRCTCGAERIAWCEDLSRGLTRGCRSTDCRARTAAVDVLKLELSAIGRRDPRKEPVTTVIASRLDAWIVAMRERDLADRLERRTGLEDEPVAVAVADDEG